MKSIFSLLVLLGVLGFSTFSYSIKVINFKDNFKQFWSVAKTQDFEEREKSWDKYIESVDPSFYDENVWSKSYDPNWKKHREMTLKNLFETYSTMDIDSYLKVYDNYEKVVGEVLDIYKEKAPDYKEDITVMIAPGITWGGSYSKNEKTNKDYLSLGVDRYFMNSLKGKTITTKALVIHEMFHHYHSQIRGNKGSKSIADYINNGKLFWQLWDEGMAVWGTSFISGNTDANYLLLGAKGTYSDEKISYYAKKFLGEFYNPGVDMKEPVNYKKWFGTMSKNNPLGEDTPPMIGYYLGYRVVDMIQKSGIKRQVYMNWSYEQAKPHILEQLKILAKDK